MVDGEHQHVSGAAGRAHGEEGGAEQRPALQVERAEGLRVHAPPQLSGVPARGALAAESHLDPVRHPLPGGAGPRRRWCAGRGGGRPGPAGRDGGFPRRPPPGAGRAGDLVRRALRVQAVEEPEGPLPHRQREGLPPSGRREGRERRAAAIFFFFAAAGREHARQGLQARPLGEVRERDATPKAASSSALSSTAASESRPRLVSGWSAATAEAGTPRAAAARSRR